MQGSQEISLRRICLICKQEIFYARGSCDEMWIFRGVLTCIPLLIANVGGIECLLFENLFVSFVSGGACDARLQTKSLCARMVPKVAIQFGSRHDVGMKILFLQLRWASQTSALIRHGRI
jgi:hypothetical protein